jgi:hypothetical protein
LLTCEKTDSFFLLLLYPSCALSTLPEGFNLTMQVTEQRPIDDNEGKLEVPAFLGLSEQQSKLLVALYNETDPEFAKQVPTALPFAAQQLANEYEKRNSVGKKVCLCTVTFSGEEDCPLIRTFLYLQLLTARKSQREMVRRVQ